MGRGRGSGKGKGKGQLQGVGAGAWEGAGRCRDWWRGRVIGGGQCLICMFTCFGSDYF